MNFSEDTWQLPNMAAGSWLPIDDKMDVRGILRAFNSDWLFGFSLACGPGDAFLAEILALEEGLLKVRHLGYKSIICESDCFALVQTMANS
ncbi:hypothetical protein CR513_59498, partial [Mucuna pruriens]